MLGRIFLRDSIAFVIAEVVYLLSYLFVLLRYFIGTYRLSYLSAKAFLSFYLYFDSLMSEVDGIGHIFFRNLIHLAFYHGYELLRSPNHDIHVGFGQLLGTGVNDELPIDTSYTYLRDRPIERNIRYCQASRSSQSCEGIRHHIFIVRHQLNHYLYLTVIFLRE